jgi:hypothetical protein
MTSKAAKAEKMKNKEEFIKALQEAGITWRVKNNGSMFAIREENKPPIDLYPTTKKWKKPGAAAVTGEVEEFIEWYLVQDMSDPRKKKWTPMKQEFDKIKKNGSNKGLVKDDLTEEQLGAFDEILDFIQVSERQEHVLIGSAGCGKTATLKVILDEVGSGIDVICTAPTNAAVKVIAEATERSYNKTIYSLLGLKLEFIDEGETLLKPSGESDASKYNLIVIDEASMISHELYNVIRSEVANYSYLKVLYIGDDAQLPPVDDQGCESPVFNIKHKSVLKTIMRTENGNPILENVSVVRDNVKKMQEVVKPLYDEDPEFKMSMALNSHLIQMETPIDKSTRKSEDGKVGIIYHDRSQFTEMMEDALSEFTSDEYDENKNFVRMLAYTNKTVGFLNNKIRARLFSDHDEIEEYMPEEDLIVSSPVMEKDKDDKDAILYTTGERLMVKKASIREYFDSKSGYKFLYWDLLVDNYEATMSKRESKWIKVVCANALIPQEEQYGERNLDINYKVANYTRFSSTTMALIRSRIAKECRRKASGGAPKRVAWAPFFEFVNSFAKVSYSYATTVHKCVPVDSKVLTSNGYVSIGNLSVGDQVVSDTGNLRAIKWISDVNSRYRYDIKLYNGEVVHSSGEHKWLTNHGYVEANNITNGTYLKLKLNSESNLFNADINIPSTIYPSNMLTPTDNLPKHIDTDLSYIVGLLIGDGCLTSLGNRIEFCNPSSPSTLSKYDEILSKYGINTTKAYKNDTLYTLVSENVAFRNILTYIGMDRSNALNKYIPDIFYNVSNELIYSLISGLIDSDGNVSHKGIRYGTSSLKLAKGLVKLLARIGAYSTIHQYSEAYYMVNINVANTYYIKDKLNLTNQNKVSRLNNIKYSDKEDTNVIPRNISDQMVDLFISEYKTKYPHTRGHKGLGFNADGNRYISSFIGRYKSGRTKNMSKVALLKLVDFSKKHGMSKSLGIMESEIGYRWVKVYDVVDSGNLVDMIDIEVDIDNSFICDNYVTHNCQGSTFTNTYVIGDDLDKLNWDRLQLNKLRYVAMSRSSHKLHVLSS